MSRLPQKFRRFTLTLCAAALLAGCGSNMSDLQSWVAEVKARKSGKIEPIPEVPPYEPYAYVPGERRDPFVVIEPQREPGTGGASATKERPDQNRPKEALEEFPLDALRMQGIIKTPRATYALVKAPDGVVHRISIGNHMGQNYGAVKGITESDITLVELVPDGLGGWQSRAASLARSE